MVADFIKKQKSDSGLGKNYLIIIFAIIFILAGVFLVYVNIKLHYKKAELMAQIVGYNKEIERIQNNNDNLKDRIKNADNKDYIEKVAREEENMQKPGESVVSFILPGEKPKEPEKETGIWRGFLGGMESFWKKVKSIFGK